MCETSTFMGFTRVNPKRYSSFVVLNLMTVSKSRATIWLSRSPPSACTK